MEARYTFRDDNDGHSYLLPVDQVEAFESWLDEDPEGEDFEEDRFNQFHVNGPIEQISFEKPRRDQ